MYGIAKDDPDYEQPHTQSLDSTFSLRQKLSLVVFIAFIGLFLYGAFEYKWGIEHLSAIFIMMSIVVAAMFGGGDRQSGYCYFR